MSIQIRRKQKGFALLEVLLAVIIIAAFAAAVVMLFNKVRGNSSLATEEQVIQSVISAHSQYVATQLAAPATLTDLVDAGYLSNAGVSTDGKSIGGAFGLINYAPDDTSYSIVVLTANGVPADVATKFCVDMVASFDVSDGTNSYDDVAACNGATWKGSNTITLTSPKGSASE